MKSVLLLTTGLILLTACEKKVENGTIPSEFLKDSVKFEGVYKGTLKRTLFRKSGGKVQSAIVKEKIDEVTITVSMNAGIPVIESSVDLTLDESCQSSVKHLKSLSARHIFNDAATFVFDRGACSGQSLDNEITFFTGSDLKGNEMFSLELVKSRTKTGIQRFSEEIISGKFKKVE